MVAWRINHESVSHDLLNGEVIAIHLGTGVYYSLRGTAAEIWQWLATPLDVSGVGQTLVAGFLVEPEPAAAGAGTFLQRLLAEDLIVEDTLVGGVAVPPAGIRQPYVPPELERFADLQDLLLLDPIHDVGAQGWPHRPPGVEQGK